MATKLELEAEVASLQAKIQELTSEEGSAKVIADLQSDKEKLQQEVNSLKEVVEELSKDNAKVTSSSNAIEIDGKQFKLVTPKFHIKTDSGAREVDLAAIKADTSLAATAKELGMLIEA